MTASKRNYYTDLQVARTASQEEIKTAFYSLSKMYHPDTATAEPENAAQKFVQITEAYEVLGNVKSRNTYDMGEWIALNALIRATTQNGRHFGRLKIPANGRLVNCRPIWVKFSV